MLPLANTLFTLKLRFRLLILPGLSKLEKAIGSTKTLLDALYFDSRRVILRARLDFKWFLLPGLFSML